MKEKKQVSLVAVILNCICAVVWSANVFVDMAYGFTNTASFVLHVACAIVWDLCAVVWVIRYLRSKKKDE